MRILLALPEAEDLKVVTGQLHAAGYLVEPVHDYDEAGGLAVTEDFAAIILDLKLARTNSGSAVRRWRAAGSSVPILAITAEDQFLDGIEAIDAGADDYLTRPFLMDELIARLRAVIRRSKGRSSPVIRCGNVTLDDVRMVVKVNGKPIGMSVLEFRAVSYLMHNKGRVIPAEELLEHVHGAHSDHGNGALEALICRIRRKVGAQLIATRRGFGYIVEDNPHSQEVNALS